MSQAGEIDVIQSHPEIPIDFITDDGTAIAINNQIEILGDNGVETSGSGNTVTVAGINATAGVDADAASVGVASFDSAAFTVTDGFVEFNGSIEDLTHTEYIVDINGGPGANFTTVQAAVDQADLDGLNATHYVMIYIRSGNYSSVDLTSGRKYCFRGVGMGAQTQENPAVNFIPTIIDTIVTNGSSVLFDNIVVHGELFAGVGRIWANDSCFRGIIHDLETGSIFRNCRLLSGRGSGASYYNCVVTANIIHEGGTATISNCNLGTLRVNGNGLNVDNSIINRVLGTGGLFVISNTTIEVTMALDSGSVWYSNIMRSAIISTLPWIDFNSGATYQALMSTEGTVAYITKTDSNLNILRSMQYIGVTDTSSPRILTLPSTTDHSISMQQGQCIEIKDESLNAGVNNITIQTVGAALIEGAASYVINVSGGSVKIRFDGTNYWVI